jgi:hypothetical protein
LVDGRFVSDGCGTIRPDALLQQVTWAVTAYDFEYLIAPRGVLYAQIARDDRRPIDQLALQEVGDNLGLSEHPLSRSMA